MAHKIQIKRGNKADLPTLDVGEFGLCQDTNELFIGNNGNQKIFPPTTPTISDVEGLQTALDNKGDMLKSEYDTDGDGKVNAADNSDKLGGQPPSAYASADHTHESVPEAINAITLQGKTPIDLGYYPEYTGATTLYVDSVTGDDSNDGLTNATAFLTLEKVAELVNNKTLTSDVTVHLNGSFDYLSLTNVKCTDDCKLSVTGIYDGGSTWNAIINSITLDGCTDVWFNFIRFNVYYDTVITSIHSNVTAWTCWMDCPIADERAWSTLFVASNYGTIDLVSCQLTNLVDNLNNAYDNSMIKYNVCDGTNNNPESSRFGDVDITSKIVWTYSSDDQYIHDIHTKLGLPSTVDISMVVFDDDNVITNGQNAIFFDQGTNPDYTGVIYKLVVVDGQPMLEVIA